MNLLCPQMFVKHLNDHQLKTSFKGEKKLEETSGKATKEGHRRERDTKNWNKYKGIDEN